MTLPMATFKVKASREREHETIFVQIAVEKAGEANFWLTRDQARELADYLQEEANWLAGIKPPLPEIVA